MAPEYHINKSAVGENKSDFKRHAFDRVVFLSAGCRGGKHWNHRDLASKSSPSALRQLTVGRKTPTTERDKANKKHHVYCCSVLAIKHARFVCNNLSSDFGAGYQDL